MREIQGIQTCGFCGQEFRSISGLERHLRVHTNERPFKCNLCHYSSKQLNSLRTHIRSHLKERIFKCGHSSCNYAAVSNSLLKQHQLVHTKERKYFCPVCNFKFGHRGHLLRHSWTHSETNEFSCKLCPFKAKTKRSVDQHMAMHRPQRSHKCLEKGCNFSAKYGSNLSAHRKIHHQPQHTQGQLIFNCPHPSCEYQTRNQGVFKTHLKVHSRERPFKCTLCDHTARMRTQLNQHMLKHTGEMPYKCRQEFCHFESRLHNDLRKHLEIHSNSNYEAAQKCTLCKYKGNSFLLLKIHRKSQHGLCREKSSKCGVSNCTFATIGEKNVALHWTKGHNLPRIMVQNL